MDLYSTYSLNRVVVPAIRTMPKLFLSMFPEMVQSDKEEILFDVEKTSRPRVTPFVHPLAKGKVVEGKGYSTKSVRPAYLKDIRVHTPHQNLKRRAGETLGGAMTVQQRMLAAISADTQDQMDMFQNRMEVMAAEAVIHGTQTIRGEGFNELVDFGRSAASKTALTSSDAWDHADMTADKLFGKLEDIAEDFRDRTGSVPDYVVMDPKAWNLMRAQLLTTAGAKYLDKNNRGYERVSVDLTPSLAGQMGLQAKGSFGDIPVFTFQSEYMDPEDGTMKKVMPDYTVLMVARSRLMGVRHFGAIQSIDENENIITNAMEYFSSSWTERNPARRMLQLESAPLMVPYYPNAVQTITVKP
jgi:hypothetical protein